MTLDSPCSQQTLTVHDLEPTTESYRDEVVEGLKHAAKRLPSKLFYDERGSQLFEEICELDEYYLTRTELAIMQANVSAMAQKIGPGALLIEPGSGASVKTRLLLDELDSPRGYMPVDISRDHLAQAASAINVAYPQLHVAPVCADFTQRFDVPQELTGSRQVVYFPGSTIGNFDPDNAVAVLKNLREICSEDAGLLLGVDRKKDIDTIEAAYNDSQGVTARFNLNILRRINDELDADFDEDLFEHRAHYNRKHGRIEMHLISAEDQKVRLNGHRFSFHAGESICTEFSYKFSIEDVENLASASGYRVEEVWSDDDEMFSVLYLAAS